MKLATRVYLGVSGVAIIGILGIPLTWFPKGWARATGWSAPPETPLEDYFSRSLGALGLALGVTTCIAALGKRSPDALLLLLPAIGGGAVAVHALGVVRGIYPLREAAEIPFLLGATLWGAAIWARER